MTKTKHRQGCNRTPDYLIAWSSLKCQLQGRVYTPTNLYFEIVVSTVSTSRNRLSKLSQKSIHKHEKET